MSEISKKLSDNKFIFIYYLDDIKYEKRVNTWFDVGHIIKHCKHKLHREDGPAIIFKNNKKWYRYGKLHRYNNPAVVYSNGTKKWWVNGKLHRIDGPAISTNTRGFSWFINGKKLDTKEVETWIKNNHVNLKTKEGQIMFILRFR